MDNISRINPFGDNDGITPLAPHITGKKTAQEATWDCPTCGIVLPYRVKFGPSKGRWLRGKCACQAEEARVKDEDELSEARMRNLITKSFAWLGSGQSDLDLASKTFDNFDRKSQPEAFDAAYRFADDLKGNLILHSPVYGTGKTHLFAAICRSLHERGIETRFVTAPKLFRVIQDCMQRKESFADIITKMINAPFLVIDDIDKVKPSDWKEERYFDIIDERTKASRPTGISTNQYDLLPAYIGGAARSRLQIGRIVVEMRPVDYRERL